MSEKILFVDDDSDLLDAMRRSLRGRFELATAGGGRQGLRVLEDQGPFAVVVSDLQMPEMDGVEFLARVKQLYPDTVRLMLTGRADITGAIDAVNRGRIFQFLTKPCSPEAMSASLTQAVRQYRLVTAERELLNTTLKGSVLMLVELLSHADAQAFSSGYRIKGLVSRLAGDLGLSPLWLYEVAGLVSQVGCVAIPRDILAKVRNGQPLTPQEAGIYHGHPTIGAQLIRRVPRLEQVAAIIAGQFRDHDDPTGAEEEADAVIGAEILRAALDYDRLMTQGRTHGEAVSQLYRQQRRYNPKVIEALSRQEETSPWRRSILSVTFGDLVPGMTAAEDITTVDGTLIIGKGQEITWPVLQELQNYLKYMGIREPIRVWA